MGRPREQGKPAKYRYREVRYSHLGEDPGAPTVLSADPWGFLYANLSEHREKRQGKNKRCIERGLYYARLAEEFFRAGDSVDLPAKATLVYYGMLNLVKTFLSCRGVGLEEVWEHHGLTLPCDTGDRLKAKTINERRSKSIFQEFARILETPFDATFLLPFKELCAQIPEIHEIAYETGCVADRKQKFLPVEIRILVNDKKTRVFTEIRYDKRHQARLPTNKFLSGKRREGFLDSVEADGQVVHRSQRRRTLREKGANWPRLYRSIQKEYADYDLVSILTRAGYRYYCDLKPGRVHHLCYTLACMFYLGTIARYRPAEVEKIMNSSRRALVTEAIAVCPQQFVYQLVGRVTKRVVVVPFSRL